jgi:hypothetical protein
MERYLNGACTIKARFFGQEIAADFAIQRALTSECMR